MPAKVVVINVFTQMWAAANPTMMMGGMQPSGRKQRELYVGNLAVGVVGGDMLKEFLSSILTQCPGYSPTMGPPVAVVQLSGEGKFAFVEFRDELIAVTALQLDKIELAGRPLNIGRPAGYQPAPGMPLPTPLPLPPGVSVGLPSAPADPQAAAAVAALVGGPIGNGAGVPGGGAPGMPALPGMPMMPPAPNPQQGRKQRELYVGNLPVGMVTAQQLKELFRAPLLTMPTLNEDAGPLVLNVDLSSDGKFAFVEFRDEPICSLALTLFDKMEVCGRALNVGRPRGYIDPNVLGSLGAAAPVTGPVTLPGVGLFADPAAAAAALVGGAVPPPPPPVPPPPPQTTCIKLENMITADILAADDEYAEVLDDIKQECESISGGPLEAIVMPREGPLACLCFIRFPSIAGAAQTRGKLDQREFDGNTVKATFIPESEFPAA